MHEHSVPTLGAFSHLGSDSSSVELRVEWTLGTVRFTVGTLSVLVQP
jgi:hypothetical protein